ncbi:homing endonuclease [Yersinia phage fPS-19]|uniref:Homing endonuclease n=10 Tax=Helsettvirus fPS9 TaxID=2733625 RepID=A0A2D0PE74_9CAUD|nr:Phage-associated homing endonuclease [Yersinia phage fPS-9]SOO46377.1 homing endonuclease [Yersinia phage fPS-52]SOO46428.1 homing endonuclease [Yersinia phage fPS-19]SOO46530.1 homing endonuclease [Yersinia phage fPS-7]SOO46682.1 homing endonuclease [Yersinia phage fPS-86]SOO46732.1 homing endonuclease [Yersinia phage fPS-50]SOO46783.1 homing endonuclease [Yersinia phage fPS-21]SOO46880.1 homing endonuclease [Yersinia phage fPS-64]SOR54335.1 homing endonuclease [Yersinia phage fPS-10]S
MVDLTSFTYSEGNLLRKGKVCGFVDNCGYLRVSINYKKYLNHRLIYKMFNTEFDLSSDLVIDHINRNRKDNRIENLRAVTKAFNNTNMELCDGVSYCKQTSKWKASLNGMWLGRYSTREGAQYAVKAKRAE